MQAHTPCKFKNRITLFKTSTLSDKVEWPSDYGWTCFSQTGVDIIPVSGEHLTLFDPVHIPPLAEALTRSLNHSPPH
jgi:thioesterase domain-containing protein